MVQEVDADAELLEGRQGLALEPQHVVVVLRGEASPLIEGLEASVRGRAEAVVLDLRAHVEREPALGGVRERLLQHRAGIIRRRLAARVTHVAEDARDALLVARRRQQGPRRRIRVQDQLALVLRGPAHDAAVDTHPLVERDLELLLGDRDLLEAALHIAEPQADKLHPGLAGLPQDIGLAVVLGHGNRIRPGPLPGRRVVERDRPLHPAGGNPREALDDAEIASGHGAHARHERHDVRRGLVQIGRFDDQ